MLPEITVHRPRGVLPKVAVGKRTTVDYQPSWLLLAVPALALLRTRRRKSRAQTAGQQQPLADVSDPTPPPTPRWRRRAQVLVVAVPRGRRRAGASDTLPRVPEEQVGTE